MHPITRTTLTLALMTVSVLSLDQDSDTWHCYAIELTATPAAVAPPGHQHRESTGWVGPGGNMQTVMTGRLGLDSRLPTELVVDERNGFVRFALPDDNEALKHRRGLWRVYGRMNQAGEIRLEIRGLQPGTELVLKGGFTGPDRVSITGQWEDFHNPSRTPFGNFHARRIDIPGRCP